MQRNLDPSTAPLPTSILSGISPQTAAMQIWYTNSTSNPVQEQYSCSATGCKQRVQDGILSFTCDAIRCRCESGSAICSHAIAGISIESAINAISGTMSFDCPTNTTTPNCSLKTEILRTIFGPGGINMTGCNFGECVQQSVVDMTNKILFSEQSKGLGTSLIVGLIVVGLVLLGLVALVLFGFLQQRRARSPKIPTRSASDGAALLSWNDLRYTLDSKSSAISSAYQRLRSAPEMLSKPQSSVLPSSHVFETLEQKTYSTDKFTELDQSPNLSSVTYPAIPLKSTYPPEYSRLQSKQILRGLSGSVEPGKMMAILGPSGAGKRCATIFTTTPPALTASSSSLHPFVLRWRPVYFIFIFLVWRDYSTFLDILAGQRKAGRVTGKLSISYSGGIGSPDGAITMGFVEQSDILPATSTVHEAVTFASKLKLPEDITREARERRVNEVIDRLGLSHVAHSRVGNDEVRGLSGGERRRLSIALELISRPSILFLDEPTSSVDPPMFYFLHRNFSQKKKNLAITEICFLLCLSLGWFQSGLDSVSAAKVVQVLKSLSSEAPPGGGTTIVCSIHQPSSQIYVGPLFCFCLNVEPSCWSWSLPCSMHSIISAC